MPVLLRPVDAMTRRVGGPPDPADADPAAIAPPTDDEIIAAWEGGKAGKGLADAIPSRFRRLLAPDLFRDSTRSEPLVRLCDAFRVGYMEFNDRVAEQRRGNGRHPK